VSLGFLPSLVPLGPETDILRSAVKQAYSTGLAEIFYNPPKGLLHVTTAIPRGMLDIIINVHEGFANLPKSYGTQPHLLRQFPWHPSSDASVLIWFFRLRHPQSKGL
jgi:hypothetical protein